MNISTSSSLAAGSMAFISALLPQQRGLDTLTSAAEAIGAHQTSAAEAVNGQIAFATDSDNSQVYVVNPDGTGERQLTHDPGGAAATMPDWSPNGTRIAYADNSSGSYDLMVMNANGTAKRRVLHRHGWDLTQPRWSPDGTKLAFTACNLTYPYCDIDIVDTDGTHLRTVVAGHVSNRDPSWSPNGNRIAFTSNRAGLVSAVWTVRVVGRRLTRLTEPNLEGFYPSWSPRAGRILLSDNEERPHSHTDVMRADGTRLRRIAGRDTGFAAWAPDSRHIVLAGNAAKGDGRYLFTMSARGSALTPLVKDVPDVLFSDWGVHPATSSITSRPEEPR